MPLPLLPTGIENQANAAFDEIKAAVDTYQSTYLATHGTYWQGIENPPNRPADGRSKTMQLSRKPTDQPQDWSWFSPSSNYPISFEVHTHGRHGKHWYSIIGHIEIGGTHYQRINDEEWLAVAL